MVDDILGGYDPPGGGDKVPGLLVVHNKGGLDAIWQWYFTRDPTAQEADRRYQMLFISRHGRQPFQDRNGCVWDDEDVTELDAWTGVLVDMLKSEHPLNRLKENE